MIKAQIGFDNYYESIKQAEIYEWINNYSETIIRCEFKIELLLELIKTHFGELICSYNSNYDYIKTEDAIKNTFCKYYLKGTSTKIAFMIDAGDEYFNYKDEDEIEDTIETEDGEILNVTELEGADEESINILNELSKSKSVNNSIVNTITIYYDINIKDQIDGFISDLNNIIAKVVQENVFYTIGVAREGYVLNKQKINTVDTSIDIALHYGEDFIDTYEDIINNLTNKSHGLFLLYGLPGTGKTMIIRHIINRMCSEKKVIYVPTYMIDNIANPEFISFLQKHKDIILVLEDAEYTLQKREEKYGAQGVSNLLNLTNGLLNDTIKVQIIATFNMDKKNIDEALLRPGRLLNEWEFKQLEIEDAQKLSDYLGKDIKITEPMTLSEIYNGTNETKLKRKEPNKIGF